MQNLTVRSERGMYKMVNHDVAGVCKFVRKNYVWYLKASNCKQDLHVTFGNKMLHSSFEDQLKNSNIKNH